MPQCIKLLKSFRLSSSSSGVLIFFRASYFRSCHRDKLIGMALAPRTPPHTHWCALRFYLQLAHNELMELEEFLRIWDVSRDELAFICDCSVTTVNHWFSQHRRFPSEKHQQKLALAHHIWTTIETEPEYLQVLREMYRKKPRRR
jgi:hypothetical protein